MQWREIFTHRTFKTSYKNNICDNERVVIKLVSLSGLCISGAAPGGGVGETPLLNTSSTGSNALPGTGLRTPPDVLLPETMQ